MLLDTLKIIRERIIRNAIETSVYKDSWGSEYTLKCIGYINNPKDDAFCSQLIKDAVNSITTDQLGSLSEKDLSDMGFALWSHEDPLYLFPLWIVPYVKGTEKIRSINEKEMTMDELRELGDLDTRVGCIAYGFYKDHS